MPEAAGLRTEFLTLDGASDTAKLAHAVRILRAGGLVAFPTETVYALGADARNPSALARLARVKGKLDSKNHSLLVSSERQAEEVAGGLPRAARKLARLYWPGPLTIVIPRAGGGNAGLRLPEHPVARSLLAGCGFPLAAPSATMAHKLKGLSAAEVRTAFEGQIDLVLEGQPMPKGNQSTVVEVSDHAVIVLREGAVPVFDLLHASAPSVLFVCTGNTCRSPMAAGLCREALKEFSRTLGWPYYVMSAGTNAQAGIGAHPLSVLAMHEAGIDISNHSATMLTPELIDSADWVFTMTREHRDSILEFMPSAADRVRTISPGHENVEEPGGQLLHRYRRCREQLNGYMRNIVREVVKA